MKYLVQLLNYDSEWITYCKADTLWQAVQADADLHHHGFQDFQIQLVKKQS